MNKKSFIFFILFVLSVGQVLANSYHAQLIAKVSSHSTGMGKVYAHPTDSTNTGEFQADSCVADVKGGQNDSGKAFPFTAYAQSTDDNKYKFVGWSDTDGGTIVSTDNPYQLNVNAATVASSTNKKWIYANFIEKTVNVITFLAASNGSFVATDSTNTITGAGTLQTMEKVYFKATPDEGYKIMGWYILNDDGTKSYFSNDESSYMTFSENKTIGVDFVTKDTPVFTIKGTDKYYNDLNEANDAADGGIIVLISSGTLSSGSYNIYSGVTLLIPFDKDYTCYTADKIPTSSVTYVEPTPYCTLTISKDASINVDGAISVSSNVYAINTQLKSVGGHVNGPYGTINMEEGSSITLNDGANLFAYGYVLGKGTVLANSGSSVYEMFQLSDFRGGTALNKMCGNAKKVFPLNQYFIQNVEAPLTICSGAQEKVLTGFRVDNQDLVSAPSTFIGSNGMFVLDDGTTLTKSFDPERDRQVYELNGDASFGTITMKLKGNIIESEKYVLPLTNNVSVYVNSGTLTVNQENGIALLPDAELTIKEGAKMLIKESALYIYDSAEWGEYTGVHNKSNPHQFVPIKSPSMTYVRTSLNDAKLDVQGEVEIANGALYTTASGANICCTSGKGCITFDNGTLENNTYQAYQEDTIVTYVPISVTSAKLKNTSTESEYTSTEDVASGTTFYFHQETGVWDTDDIPTAILDPEKQKSSNISDVQIYDLNGQKRNVLRRGINILRESDGAVQKVMNR